MSFDPNFRISASISKALVAIERHKTAIEHLPISTSMIASLRESARLMSTHYSTQIEGNRLSPREVEIVVGGKAIGTPGRERDELEVRNYFRALEHVEDLARRNEQVSEQGLQRIHGLAFGGCDHATPYRDGQNVIRDSSSGRIVYMPPEHTDVPRLMSEFVDWMIRILESRELPVAIIAAISHYQFATIHPYYDGNGRTARLLTTWILHLAGYGLGGIYSLEEYYAKDLPSYYAALDVCDHHNYYMGRADVDITRFIEYFVNGMATSFESVHDHAVRTAGSPDHSDKLRLLSPLQRHALALFRDQAEVASKDLAKHLGISPRSSTDLCRSWTEDGFLVIINPSRKARTYGLHAQWEELII